MAQEPLAITRDTTLPKDATLDRRIVIQASGITLDGNGATLVGPGRAGEPDSFAGVGIVATGCSGVTLRNVRVRGFCVGLAVTDAAKWIVEDCDFSGNFTDPAAGWDVERRLGGIVLTRVCESTLRRNAARHVWNALDLDHCHDNTIAENAFCHCSNVCLKLWTCCRDRVERNDLSHGLRIDPGEVHARDSACVLIESGSDDNWFQGNDITHGGDGVFIRVLNGWVSRGNHFIENDCSHANNNGFEAWSPDNTYVRNKANHCSHGFWLGASDHTVLIGNEAAHNGSPDGFHNAAEPLFGHGGIVFVGGSSSHTIARGNHCHHNNGGGIVLRGDVPTRGAAWRAYHWILQDNRLDHNRFGIHAQFADLLFLSNNDSSGSREPDFFDHVTRLSTLPSQSSSSSSSIPSSSSSPSARLDGPARVLVGQRVAFDASASSGPAGRPLTFLWDIGGVEHAAPRIEHVFDAPGLHRVALTVSNGHLADLAWKEVYAVRETDEIGTERAATRGCSRAASGSAARWSFRFANEGGHVAFSDVPEALVGRTSLRARVEPCPGGLESRPSGRSGSMAGGPLTPEGVDSERESACAVELILPAEGGWHLSGRTHLSFWLKRRMEGVRGFQGANPVVVLHGTAGRLTLTPKDDANRVDSWSNPSESRWGWLFLSIPLAGDDAWLAEAEGIFSLAEAERLVLRFTPHDPAPFTLWLDGLGFVE